MYLYFIHRNINFYNIDTQKPKIKSKFVILKIINFKISLMSNINFFNKTSQNLGVG
jgi:hypothetical protein